MHADSIEHWMMRQCVGRQYFRIHRLRGSISGNQTPPSGCVCGAVFATNKSANRRRFSAASASAQHNSSICSKERFIPTKTFKHLLSNNRSEKERLLKALAERLRFFFSDVNLRHDEYGRRILELHEKQFLPLDTIMTFKTIRRLSTDPSDLLEAVDVANETSNGESPSIQLFTAESENGDVLIGRAPIFNHDLSYRRSLEKMMIIEGWPGDQFDTRWAEARVRSLLLTGIADPHTSSRLDPRTNLQPIPVAYWRRDVPRGLLTIEFLEEEGALQAWENIDRFADMSSDSFQVLSIPTSESRYVNAKDRLYRFSLNGWDLIVRPMELSAEEEKALLVAIPSRTKPDVIGTEVDLENELHSELHDHDSELISMENNVVSRVEECTVAGHAPSLQQLTSNMNDLYQRHKQLPAPSRDWLHEYRRLVSKRSRSTDIIDQSGEEETIMRQKLLQEVASLIAGSQLSVSSGIIRGMGSKDSYLLSDALGKAMEVFSETPILAKRGQSRAERISPFDSCLDVLSTLKSLNLDIHPFHYACAVRAACHESRFDDAARIFLSQIDDDSGVGGYVPIEASFDWDHPLLIGLYAVARESQYASMDAISTSDTVSHSQAVFDTAKKLSMISPSNHDTYVLAGGIALGRAGLWYDCLGFVTNQEGHTGCYWPAGMLACLESSRSAEAVDLYEYFRDPEKNAASEWQWDGGRSESVLQLCRDLALQAMGNVASGGQSKNAMSLFREIMSDDSPMSTAALVGVARSLEYDGDWQTSIQLLDAFLESIDRGNSNWRLVTESLHLMDISKTRKVAPAGLDIVLVDLLSSVMRCCNNSKQFGMSVLLCSVVGSRDDVPGSTTSTSAGDASPIVTRILSQSIVSENKHIRKSYLHSLIGLGCAGLASDIASQFGEDLYAHKRNNAPKGETAISAITSMSRVNATIHEIQLREQDKLSAESIEILLRGLGRAMNHLIDSRQPAAALYLHSHVKNQLEALSGQRVDTFTEQVKTYFDSSESRMGFQLSALPWQQDKLVPVGMSDTILSSLIDAYRDMGHPDEAREIFADFCSSCLDHPVPMPQSANSFANVLLRHDSIEECMDFLKSLDRDSINPSTFLSLARALAQRGLWSDIGKLYNSAHKAGCLSEELALIAIQAVCESKLIHGKILVLRDIVNDASNLAGIKNRDWVAERYWRLKRYAGHHYARLLMRWNDQDTNQKEELKFAIHEMRRCAANGIVPKNDPLLCIVKIAHLYCTEGRRTETALTPSQQRSAVNLILEACAEADKSGLMTKPVFSAEVVRSLRAMKANKECIQLVRTLVTNSERNRHRFAMEQAIYAASEDRDQDSLHLFIQVYERSGFDSTRLNLS